MNARIFQWPARRAGLDIEPAGYECGFLPGTFEPIETLGDTGAVPLDEAPALSATDYLCIEARWHRRMYALVVLALAAGYFGWLA